MAKGQTDGGNGQVKEVGGKRLFQEADMQELHSVCKVMYVNFAGR